MRRTFSTKPTRNAWSSVRSERTIARTPPQLADGTGPPEAVDDLVGRTLAPQDHRDELAVAGDALSQALRGLVEAVLEPPVFEIDVAEGDLLHGDSGGKGLRRFPAARISARIPIVSVPVFYLTSIRHGPSPATSCRNRGGLDSLKPQDKVMKIGWMRRSLIDRLLPMSCAHPPFDSSAAPQPRSIRVLGQLRREPTNAARALRSQRRMR